MRTAVLGAGGFVGRALVSRPAERGEVLAVSRRPSAPSPPGVRSIAADVTDAGSVRALVPFQPTGFGAAAREALHAAVRPGLATTQPAAAKEA